MAFRGTEQHKLRDLLTDIDLLQEFFLIRPQSTIPTPTSDNTNIAEADIYENKGGEQGLQLHEDIFHAQVHRLVFPIPSMRRLLLSYGPLPQPIRQRPLSHVISRLCNRYDASLVDSSAPTALSHRICWK